MSMRDFLGGECGQNPVLKVASHFTRDSLTSGLGPSTSRQGEQFVLDANRQDVSLLPPTTFQMDSLLREIQSMGAHSKAPVQAPAIAELAAHPEWAAEFLRSEQQLVREGEGHQEWTRDYMAKELALDHIWDQEQFGPEGGQVGHEHYHPNLPLSQSHLPPHLAHLPQQSYQNQPSAQELLDDSKWVTEFRVNEPITSSVSLEKTELMATAEEFLKSVSDPKIKATEFMSFVEQLSTGEIGPDGQKSEARSAAWATEFERENQLGGNRGDLNWTDEFVTGGAEGAKAAEGLSPDFWQKLNDEWEKAAQEDNPSHPWLSGTTDKFNEPYQFSEENPFQEVHDAFAEGKKKLMEGEIPSAALLFEVAVQKNPENPECWLLLGTTQALNEQDPLSIAALNKCLDMDPNNGTALMSLAASLFNESFHLQACNCLKRWLKSNSKYSNLVEEDLGNTLPRTTSILPSNELSKVQRLFIQAARQNPIAASVDPDVQCGLGILFSLGTEFDKASDCFQAALGVNPDNPLLWTRLGATLANGGRSSEAIGAYRRALEISPGIIRTRYNLGIACINLGAYREAAEHFLSSLNIQASGKQSAHFTDSGSNKSSMMSDSIWSSLRTVLHLLDRSPLSSFIDNRDLEGLNRELRV